MPCRLPPAPPATPSWRQALLVDTVYWRAAALFSGTVREVWDSPVSELTSTRSPSASFRRPARRDAAPPDAPAAEAQPAAGALEGRCRHADGAGGCRQWLSSEGFDHRGRDYDICKRRSPRCAVSAGDILGTHPRGCLCGPWDASARLPVRPVGCLCGPWDSGARQGHPCLCTQRRAGPASSQTLSRARWPGVSTQGRRPSLPAAAHDAEGDTDSSVPSDWPSGALAAKGNIAAALAAAGPQQDRTGSQLQSQTASTARKRCSSGRGLGRRLARFKKRPSGFKAARRDSGARWPPPSPWITCEKACFGGMCTRVRDAGVSSGPATDRIMPAAASPTRLARRDAGLARGGSPIGGCPAGGRRA